MAMQSSITFLTTHLLWEGVQRQTRMPLVVFIPLVLTCSWDYCFSVKYYNNIWLNCPNLGDKLSLVPACAHCHCERYGEAGYSFPRFPLWLFTLAAINHIVLISCKETRATLTLHHSDFCQLNLPAHHAVKTEEMLIAPNGAFFPPTSTLRLIHSSIHREQPCLELPCRLDCCAGSWRARGTP